MDCESGSNGKYSAGVDRSGRGFNPRPALGRGCNPKPVSTTGGGGGQEGWGFGVLGYNWGVMCFGKIFADGRNPQQGRRMNVRGKFAASAASAACAAASAAAIAISATFNSAAHADHFGGINDSQESYNFAFDKGRALCEAEGVGGTYFRTLCYQDSSLSSRTVSACRLPEAQSYTYQGQVTMFTTCRTDYDHHRFTNNGDEEGLFPAHCVQSSPFAIVDEGNTPLCHYAFPECAEGVEYTIAGNPFSGCPSACPAEQTENEAGECECPSGRIKSLDSSACLMESEECPSGQVSDGDSENPQCVLMCAPFLGDNSPNPQAVLISLQSPVVSLVSGRDGDDNFACRCPAGQVIRRDAQGRWECTEAECPLRFLITDGDDDTLQICATENVGGCTTGNGYASDFNLPRRGDVSNGDAALLCDIRNRNRFSGHQTDNCLLFHADDTLESAHGFPRCDIISPSGLTGGGYSSRSTPRQTFYWNNCADGSENTDTGTGCMVCEEGFFSFGGSMCAAGGAVSFSGSVGGTVLASLDGSGLESGAVVRPGATVTFTAEPGSADYYVSGWGGGCAANGERFGVLGGGRTAECAAQVSGDFSTEAFFSRAEVSVMYSAEGAGGTLSARVGGVAVSAGEVARVGATLVWTARPGEGYYASEWLGHCAGRGSLGVAGAPGGEVGCRFRVATAEVSVGVVFSRARRVGVGGVENGRVRIESGGLALDDFGPADARGATVWVADGARVTLTGTPAGGYFVSEWTGACAGAEVGTADVRGSAGALKCGVAATVDLEAGVVFAEGFKVDWLPSPAFGALAASVVGGSALTVGGGGGRGATVVFTARPDAGRYVSGWEGGRFGSCDVGFAADFDAEARECSGVLTGEVLVGNAPVPIMTRLPRSTIYFSAGAGGTVLARVGGAEATVGGTVLHGVSVVFEARAFGGWTVGVWTGDCAGTSGRGCTIAASGGNEISVGVGFGDVDECATGHEAVCGTNSECTNTIGSHECACRSGFQSLDGRDCSTCELPTIAHPESGECVAPDADVCSRFSPGRFFDSGAGQCADFKVCSGAAVLNVETNVCVCEAPNVGTGTDCRAPSVEVCEEVSRFFDSGECAALASCTAPARRDEETNVCVCEAPNVGTGTSCQAPSVDVCRRLDMFFDETECVDFDECGTGMVLDRTTNRCMDLVCGTGEVLNEAGDACVCGVNRERVGGACACVSGSAWEVGGVCVRETGDFVNEDGVLCDAFGGRVQGEVCLGLDQAGTFCILDSAAPYAFPCRGLFKHLRTCNLLYQRPALNPFVCNTVCVSGTAQGGSCIGP